MAAILFRGGLSELPDEVQQGVHGVRVGTSLDPDRDFLIVANIAWLYGRDVDDTDDDSDQRGTHVVRDHSPTQLARWAHGQRAHARDHTGYDQRQDDLRNTNTIPDYTRLRQGWF